jgi:hypothetical protein
MDIDNKRRQRWLLAAKRCNDRLNVPRMIAAGKELDEFLESEAGCEIVHGLLNATNRHVVFGETNAMHPRQKSTAYILKGGPGGGLWMMKDMTASGIFSSGDYVTSEQVPGKVVIEVAVRCRHLEPDQVLPWLLEELDKIAESIP